MKIIALTAAFLLASQQLDAVTAGAQTSPGAPFSQAPVKGKNVVTGVKTPAKCQCGPGAKVKK